MAYNEGPAKQPKEPQGLGELVPEVPEGPYGDPQGRWDLATGTLRRIVRVRPDKLWPPEPE